MTFPNLVALYITKLILVNTRKITSVHKIFLLIIIIRRRKMFDPHITKIWKLNPFFCITKDYQPHKISCLQCKKKVYIYKTFSAKHSYPKNVKLITACFMPKIVTHFSPLPMFAPRLKPEFQTLILITCKIGVAQSSCPKIYPFWRALGPTKLILSNNECRVNNFGKVQL